MPSRSGGVGGLWRRVQGSRGLFGPEAPALPSHPRAGGSQDSPNRSLVSGSPLERRVRSTREPTESILRLPVEFASRKILVPRHWHQRVYLTAVKGLLGRCFERRMQVRGQRRGGAFRRGRLWAKNPFACRLEGWTEKDAMKNETEPRCRRIFSPRNVEEPNYVAHESEQFEASVDFQDCKLWTPFLKMPKF